MTDGGGPPSRPRPAANPCTGRDEHDAMQAVGIARAPPGGSHGHGAPFGVPVPTLTLATIRAGSGQGVYGREAIDAGSVVACGRFTMNGA
jgi:hypothetical protein